ncbi:MAG: cysteine desulfurase NifS [Christensenellales bacterium]
MEQKRIYMDHAATTYVKPEVLDAMTPYFTEHFGNPSSIHSFARETKKAIDHAREQVANAIGATPSEIFFTSGATESDNWALRGMAYQHTNKGNHIITTAIEHHAILHTCQALEKEGFEVTYLEVDENGLVTPEQVKNAITDKTILVSVMFANNEIGTIEPIEQIGAVCKEKGVVFHTDAVQAFGAVPIDVNKMNIDLLSITGHKLYGPKGTGALYIRKGVILKNLIEGGAQERGKRPGTENIAGIVGLGKAAELANEHMEENAARLTALRDQLIDGILQQIPETRLNGHRTKRLPNNVNICFRYIEGESLLLLLDRAGIAASSGSACTSGSLDPSHVLLAIGLPHEIAHGSLRLTLGACTTEEDVLYTIETLKTIVERLRQMSPLYHKA